MHGIIPTPVDRQGFLSQRGLLALAANAVQFGLSGGVHDTVGSQGVTPKPRLDIDYCFAFVDDQDNNKHAWTEADFSSPTSPRRLSGGRRGTITGTGSGSGASIDDQVAYGLNGEFYDIDDIIFIVRIGYNAWGIVGGMADGEGSGSGQGVSITCADGSQYTATISGNSISVL